MKQKKIIDSTGATLMPANPSKCEGSGANPKFECCCDECDYYTLCFTQHTIHNTQEQESIEK